jgi:hypothetical protein
VSRSGLDQLHGQLAVSTRATLGANIEDALALLERDQLRELRSRHTIHLPSGSASNQVQPAPAQAGHLSFSGWPGRSGPQKTEPAANEWRR